MNETRNTESQISTRGLDFEMEKKMTQTEINNKIKEIEENQLEEMHFSLEMFKALGLDLTKDLDKILKACEKYNTQRQY